MFPAPSPNSQALFNQLASGGATPSTLEFHRTALNAAAANKREKKNQTFSNGATSQAHEQRAGAANMDQSSQQPNTHQHFGEHDNDAANGLFLLAQAGNETQSNNQFAIPNQPSHTVPAGPNSHETSPNVGKRAARTAPGSMAGSISGSVRGQSEVSGEMSDSADQPKPATRTKSKRVSTAKATNPRRKAEETPSKQSSTKKAKGNNGTSITQDPNLDLSMDGMDSDEEANIKEEQYHENGKKMTDEEKRKNFLERNRYGAS